MPHSAGKNVEGSGAERELARGGVTIADDAIDVDEYVRNTFATEEGAPESPACPRKLKTASSFVYRLSDRYDKGEIRELSPALKNRLLDSLNVLAKYGEEFPWAGRESDFASFLLATIPVARGGNGVTEARRG